VRCVVLASTHEKTFSSGGNLAGFAADVPLVHKHVATERFPRCSPSSASSASRSSAPSTATAWPVRWGWRWPAT
jgi:enoyl-CoA hydratase/carnithine racemase